MEIGDPESTDGYSHMQSISLSEDPAETAAAVLIAEVVVIGEVSKDRQTIVENPFITLYLTCT